jgi:hypothetical protein
MAVKFEGPPKRRYPYRNMTRHHNPEDSDLKVHETQAANFVYFGKRDALRLLHVCEVTHRDAAGVGNLWHA